MEGSGQEPRWATALRQFNSGRKREGKRYDDLSVDSTASSRQGEGQQQEVPVPIPPFFKPKTSTETFDKHVKAATIHEYVQSQSERILSSWNLEGVWAMIVQNSEEHPDTKDKFITYAGVCNLAETLFELLGPLLSFHFTPSKFLSFRRNPIGGISSIVYFTAICQRNLRLQLKLLLLNYDKCGDGMISLEDFDSALDEIVEKRMIQDIPLPQSGFIASWKKIVTHKFVVQLLKTRSMKEESHFSIKSILKSDAFRELTELPSLAMSIFYNGPFAKRIEANWFSLQSTQRVHRAFLNLDQDNDMFITRKEFMRLEPGMTDIFVDRVFSEHVSSFDNYSSNQSAPKLSLKRRSSVLLMRKTIANMRKSKRGCMSYDDYLTFMVAWSNKRSPYALKYFFRVFDLEKRGLLTHVEIHTFFREVFSKYVENNQYNDIRMEDVRDEIFDMVNQEVPGQITQKDILSSSVQEILVDVLSDYNGFWRYDNREYLMQMEEEEEEQ